MATQTRLLLILVAAASIVGGSVLAATRTPNVVFILADDLGWKDVGCNGSHFYETPNIDRLASQGVRFTQAYAASSVCSPTRASIMTGKYPARLQLTDWLPGRASNIHSPLRTPALPDHLDLKELTIGEAFSAAGYKTCFIGKWHLGGDGFEPTDQGFQTNIGGCELGHPPSYFSPYRIPTLPDGPKGEYLTDRLTNEAVEFIHRERAAPFFLYLSHYAVHNPQQAKPELIEKYRQKLKQEPGTSEPEFVQEGDHKNRAIQNQPVYAAMIQSLDESVGRVMEAIEREGLSQQTVVVFFSDNGGVSTAEGFPTSNLPLRAGKGWNYEGGIREPLIVKWPGAITPGATCDQPVISNDFFPTLLEMAGLAASRPRSEDGTSFVTALKGGVMAPRPLFWHYPHYSNQGGRPAGAVRYGDLKLIEWYEDGRVELFDLRSDCEERHDLAAEQPGRANELREMLANWRHEVGAAMPVKNPDFVPGDMWKPARPESEAKKSVSTESSKGD